MKKKSIKDLNGLKISREDRERIADKKSMIDFHKSAIKMSETLENIKDIQQSGRVDLQKVTSSIADSLKGFKSVTSSFQKQNAAANKKTESLFKKIEAAIIESKTVEKKAWQFDVRRNEKGFISKVYAKQV